ncbi:hypothetical protein TKK_0001924 [Trichogramma kaykai]|uniref:Epidermal growth factor receptor substrate 15-like 1 n=1 Tax=Trichogramma kaykai TaxID=54128 RepID=A0ABD2X9W2_9HYME
MAALPPPEKVSGPHYAIFDAYFNYVDAKKTGQIGALDAAKFLKKSNLSDIILGKIWDMADPNSRGYLDKPGMFVALKLCALSQNGHSLNMANIFMDVPPPKMGDIKIQPPKCPQSISPVPGATNWSINPQERAKYEKLFHSLEPTSGYIPGNKVKSVLMDSKLPLETLGKIWDLADMDKDGKLNLHEFTIAMHLVYKALEKNTVPNVLPSELLENRAAPPIVPVQDPITFEPKPIKPPMPAAPAIPPIASIPAIPIIPPVPTKSDWIISAEEQRAANELFSKADRDMDGFVSGAEIKDVFLQSGLPQTVLAHIWGLCDMSQSGKLNKEQFALSIYLIKQKLSGKDLPNQLLPNMIPPSQRRKSQEAPVENNNVCTYSNPELNMIAQEINEIIREKLTIEQDISQKEADIKIKNGEMKSLQSELDTLAATLRQLDNQKGEAQKRLNDLRLQVDKLQQQATDQEVTLKAQEDELNSKRQEIEAFRQTEQKLETQQTEFKNKLNDLTKQLASIQLQISQTKAGMTQLNEQKRQITDAIAQFDSALAMQDATMVPDSALLFKALLDPSMYNLNGNAPPETTAPTEEIKRDAYNNNQQATDAWGTPSFPSDTQDPFAEKFQELQESVKDPFGDDPFAALHAPVRGQSPSPALPPKKSKQPPPRPAPPRPTHGPTLQAQSSPVPPSSSPDPFGDKAFGISSSAAMDGFADFANFDGN